MSFGLVFELFVLSSEKKKTAFGIRGPDAAVSAGKRNRVGPLLGPNPSVVMTFACTRANGLRQAVNRQKKPKNRRLVFMEIVFIMQLLYIVLPEKSTVVLIFFPVFDGSSRIFLAERRIAA